MKPGRKWLSAPYKISTAHLAPCCWENKKAEAQGIQSGKYIYKESVLIIYCSLSGLFIYLEKTSEASLPKYKTDNW